MNNSKPWRCPHDAKHTLGQVVRNGSGVRRLLLYRQAVVGDEQVDVMAVIEGYVADVRCSICGGVRTWVPGEEAMRQLMETVFVRMDR